MRGLLPGAALSLMAGIVAAQDAQQPILDSGLLEQCLSDKDQGSWPVDPREACIGVAADACMEAEGGGTTVGMVHCLDQERALWDAKLNQAYAEVMSSAQAIDKEMSDLGSAAEKQEPFLRKMQRDWISFRDAACGFEYSRWGGGTGSGPASLQCLLTLTARQYLWLDRYRGEGQ